MKRWISVMLVLAFVLCFSSVAFAQAPTTTTTTNGTDSFSTQGVTTSSQQTVTNNVVGDALTTENYGSGGLPNVKIAQAQNWIERKGFQLVSLLQTFVQPFAVILFIGCALLSGLGSFGNSQLLSRGILGMVIAILMYAVVLSAPELLDWAYAWLRT